jgi:hypothetical protein
MPLQAKQRVKSTDKAKIIVYVGDQQNAQSQTYPIFISVARNILTELGGVKKFGRVPIGTYLTDSGLTHSYFKDSDGLLWKKVTGIKKGVNYNHTSLVTVANCRNALTLYLAKTEVKKVPGKTSTTPTSKQVKLLFPSYVTEATVQEFILAVITPSLIVGQKFGKTLTATGTILKATRGTPASKKLPQTPRYSIMGTITSGAANTNGALNKSAGKSSKSVVIAQFTEKAAEAFGFTGVVACTAKDVKEGTKIVGNNADKRFTGFSVVDKPILHDSVWSDAGENSNQNISDSGTGVTVKVRFNYLSTAVTQSPGGNGKRAPSSTYVKFACPAGTPVGMIAKFIVNLKRYGVSFQISTDGKNYGTSYPLPNKPGMGLQRVTTTARTAGKVRNRRRGARR